MITREQAEEIASRDIRNHAPGTRIGCSREVNGGWAFFPVPRVLFEGSGAYYEPAIAVRASDGRAFQTDGTAPLERELRHFGMALGSFAELAPAIG